MPFLPFLLALALELLDDSEVKINDMPGEDDHITFKSSLPLLYFPDEFNSHFQMKNKNIQIVHSPGHALITPSLRVVE